LKPGGYIVAFSGARTYHRMTCAIEDAGFIIHPMLAWIFGTGFEKGKSVSKEIDKKRKGEESDIRNICRIIRLAMDAKGLKSRDLINHFGNCHPRLIDHWAARDTDSQPSVPTWPQWLILREVLGISSEYDSEVKRLNAAKGEFGEDWYNREITGHNVEWHNRSNYALSSRDACRRDSPSSSSAKQWDGWFYGTQSLKPALEPICMAQKPYSEKTGYENVLKWGTGAINIDACRVGYDGGTKGCTAGPSNGILGNGLNGEFGKPVPGLGRWPANLCHDGSEEVLALFPESKSEGGDGYKQPMFCGGKPTGGHGLGDSGSAARFFYSAKADADDRIGSRHPTIKPVDLMCWLVRLVTPKGGTVLDPFAGSGTTGEAAWREGFSAILIENEAESCTDIVRRMEMAVASPNERLRVRIEARGLTKSPGPLFEFEAQS